MIDPNKAHLPDCYFSNADGTLVKWQRDDSLIDDTPDDDEELAETPPDVVWMLGFDPKTDPDFLSFIA